MDRPTSLHRFSTYLQEKEQHNIYDHAIETSEGWYILKVDENTDDFVLTTPKDQQIEDNLKDFYKRGELYYSIEPEGMIYYWIIEAQKKINKARIAMGESSMYFKIDDIKYHMRVNAEAETVWITLPRQTRVFTVKNMYLENADLPLIQDGKLDDEIRKRLQHKKLELPRVPYKVALGINKEITNTSNEKTS